MKRALLPCLALLAAASATGQEPPAPEEPPPGAGQEPRAPEGDLFAPADPFAAPGATTPAPPTAGVAASAGPSWFDPDAVRAGTASEGLRLGPIELHGRANVTFSYTDGLEPIELLDHAELELSSADLYAEWFPATWFGLLGEVELSRDLEETGPGPGDARKLEVEPELLVAELRPLGDDRVRVRAGLFPVPFGVERRYYAPPRNELVTRPAAFRTVFPGTWADLGALVWVRQPLPFWGGELEAEAALIRGLEGPGEREDRQTLERDENHEPMLAGRIGWSIFDARPDDGAPLRASLTVGASLVAGHHDDDAKRRLRYEGFDAALRLGPFTARVELVLARVELEPPEGSTRRHGLYVTAAWRQRFEDLDLLQELYLAARWDLVDFDVRVRDARDVERFGAAVGWAPIERVLVKVEGSRARYLDERVWTVLAEVGYAF